MNKKETENQKIVKFENCVMSTALESGLDIETVVKSLGIVRYRLKETLELEAEKEKQSLYENDISETKNIPKDKKGRAIREIIEILQEKDLTISEVTFVLGMTGMRMMNSKATF